VLERRKRQADGITIVRPSRNLGSVGLMKIMSEEISAVERTRIAN